jgi:uncharacterized protein (TIGR03435 family)
VGPSSLDAEYAIVATLPRGTTNAQLDLMLRNMLSERFGLTFHAVSKNLSGFELHVAAGGPKLPPFVEVEPAVDDAVPTPQKQNTSDDHESGCQRVPERCEALRMARCDSRRCRPIHL